MIPIPAALEYLTKTPVLIQGPEHRRFLLDQANPPINSDELSNQPRRVPRIIVQYLCCHRPTPSGHLGGTYQAQERRHRCEGALSGHKAHVKEP